MERTKIKRGLLRAALAALMVTLMIATVVTTITTATGCLVCRDCGPRPNRHR